MRWRSHGTACALTLALAATVTACGSGVTISVTTLTGAQASVASTSAPGNGQAGVPDATTVVHEARAAYRKATSAHVHESLQNGAQTQVVDIRGSMDGSNQELTVDDSVNGNATVRTVDAQYYIKGDRTFWAKGAKADAAAVTLLADKWVLAPDAAAKGFKKLTIRQLLDDMIGPAAVSDSDTERMRTYSAIEQDTELYVAFAADAATQDVDTLKIEAASPHNVTEITERSNANGSNGTADFDGWDTQPKVVVPRGFITFPGSGPTGGPTI